MWLSLKFQARHCKAYMKTMSVEIQKIIHMKDNIPPIYDELETIFK